MARLTFTDEEMKEIDKDLTCPVKNDDITQRFCDMVCDEFQFDCPFERLGKKLKVYEDLEERLEKNVWWHITVERVCRCTGALSFR